VNLPSAVRRVHYGGLVVAVVGFFTVLGVAWAVVLALVAAGMLMPVWISAVGVGDLVFPNVTATSVMGHVLWGFVLGAVYGVLRERDTAVDAIVEHLVRTLDSGG